MKTFETVGMSEVSADEMEQVDGGMLVFFIGMAIGYGVTKSIMDDKGGGGGGGEPLPGFNGFLASTKGIAAAAHAH